MSEEEGGNVTFLLQGRPGGLDERRIEFAGDDLGQ